MTTIDNDTTRTDSGGEDWRDQAAALLAAMRHGTWTASTDLAQFLGRRTSDVMAFFAAAHPDGHDRVLSDTGQLRRGAAFKGVDRSERASALANVGIVFDDEGRADPAMRLDVADLHALAADPKHGIGPGRSRRTWLDAPGFNDTAADRARIIELLEACIWKGVSESFTRQPYRLSPEVVRLLPSRLIAATGSTVVVNPMAPDPTETNPQAEPDANEKPLFTVLQGMRSLESGCVIEAYVLSTLDGRAPVLVVTRPVPQMQTVEGPRTPCHTGRHGQCHGRYGRGAEGECRCRCGCTDPCRVTFAPYLVNGGQYSHIAVRRRMTVRGTPELGPGGHVRLTVKDHISGAEFTTTELARELVQVHNPRRRVTA